MADKSVKVSKHANEALGSNSATRIPNVVDAGLGSFPTVSEAHGNHSPASANKENINDASIVNNVANNGTTVGPTLTGNTHGMSTSYANVTSEPSRNTMSFHTLITPAGNGVDVVVLVAYPVVANNVRNTWGKYGLVKSMLNSSTGLFSFWFCSMDGLDAMLENDLWFIRNNPLIMKKCNPDVNLLKEDVGNIPVWVKLHGVLVMTFSEDGLSAIATNGDECPKNIGSDVAKNWNNPSQAPRGVLVCPKVGFKPIKQVYRPLSKKNNVNTSGNKKKDVESRKEGTSNLASKEVNSSGSSFWNVGDSSTSTTPIVDKIDKFEKLIIDGKVTLVDGFFASERVGFGTNSLLEQWKDTYENDDYDMTHMMMICMMARKFSILVQCLRQTNLDIMLWGRF
ncbi:reverse transcriptase domain-containing protein [Tanacetum coccineum]|uniref:Reverse transcriptase domain-containing protein n=1 Tax=Tanacetum coccineum TaxID=301880 RepID=A0ABQ5F6J8_9ASTR